jgi:hypothetical protein
LIDTTDDCKTLPKLTGDDEDIQLIFKYPIVVAGRLTRNCSPLEVLKI